MQESKYFYQKKPLSQYCKENNLNIDTIRTRIWKMKHSKKYKDLSDDEIIAKVIKAYGTATKYKYNGVSLRQYCLKNGLEYSTILSRVNELKKKNVENNNDNNSEQELAVDKKLTDDEIVTLAIEEFKNKNYRFFYDGIPLKEYCELHPEINYNTIRTFINREKERNPKLTDEELIDRYIAKEHKGIYKWYYLGFPLIDYCFEANLNYKNIILYINRNKNKEEFKNLAADDFIAAIMDKYEPFEPKYLYNGTTLRAYCCKNDISYFSVISYIKRKKAKDNQASIDNLIEEAINTIKRYGVIYYYQGIPLKDYAKQNNLNVCSIRQAILRKKVKSDKPLQEIVNECVESYQKFSTKYFYNGIPLTTFCKSINLNYNTVIHRYLEEYANRDDITLEAAIKEICDYYLENPPIKRKYYFNEMSLADFCKENGYPLYAIYNRLQTLRNNKEDLENTELVETAIKKYEQKLHMNKLNEIFEYLKNNSYIPLENLHDICEFLKVDFETIIDLYNMDFSYYQSINMIWYFSDSLNGDSKTITDTRLIKIFQLAEKIKNSSDKEIEKMELYDLIAIYKCALFDSRTQIIKERKNYIKGIIYRLCNEYEVKITRDNFEDFKSEIICYFIRVIDNNCSNIYGQMIKYFDMSVKGYFRLYLKKYKQNSRVLLLDDEKYQKDKGNNNAKRYIDDIADSTNQFEELETNAFFENLLEVLKQLSSEDKYFIILKFKEDYSDSELSEHFNLTLEEVKEKEYRILSLLKDKKKFKCLRKIITTS